MAVIEYINVGGNAYEIASTVYATCSQTATTAAKTISISGLTIAAGVTIHVKFTNGNTAESPTLAITGADDTTAHSIVGITTWSAGAVIMLTFDGNSWVKDYVGSISDNITGSGTSGYLAKFNSGSTITNGPQLGNDATKFLNNKGEWAVPAYIPDTHYTATLAVGNSNTDKTTEAVTASTTGVRVNLIENNTVNTSLQFAGAGGITIGSDANGKITFTGKSGTVTSVGVTSGGGLTTSNASNAAITTTGTLGIATGGVTNAMLAGSIENSKLSNSKVTIAGNEVSLGGSVDATTLRSSLGLSQALRFVGSTTTTMSDGYTGTPAGISIYTGTGAVTPAVGDVVLDSASSAEYVCISVSGTTYTWELLGDESSWALDNDVLKKTGAKGDIIYWSDVDTPTHLTAGTDGLFLKLVGGVPTWAADNNDDTKVTQAYSTSGNSFPLLFSATNGITSTSSRGATTALLNNTIYVVPSAGEIHATTFYGDGSHLSNITASSVAWGDVSGKVLSALYINTTAAGTNSDVATTNTTTYMHLYDNNAKQSTVQFKGAGGTTIESTNSKVVTVTSKKYKDKGSANALTSLTLGYNNGTAQTNSVSTTATAIGIVDAGTLYIKSIQLGTTSVSTGIEEDNT